MTTETPQTPIPLVEGFRFELDGAIGTLTIDRPQKLGALSRDMWFALPDIIAAIDRAPEIDVLILRGTDGNFSAGSDIHDLNVPLADFWSMNSAAEDALATCDIRIAAPGSRFGITAAKLGLVYPPGPTRRFAAAIGESWARYQIGRASCRERV